MCTAPLAGALLPPGAATLLDTADRLPLSIVKSGALACCSLCNRALVYISTEGGGVELSLLVGDKAHIVICHYSTSLSKWCRHGAGAGVLCFYSAYTELCSVATHICTPLQRRPERDFSAGLKPGVQR